MDPELETRPRLDYRAAVRDYLRNGPEPLANLVDYTNAQLRARTWMGIFGGPLPGGDEAQDIVRDIIVNVIRSDRSLGPAEDIGVEVWLKGRIRSKVSNLVRSFENTKRDRRTDADEGYDELDSFESENGGTTTVEHRELEAALEALLLDFLTFIENDKTSTKLMECLMDGVQKREAIAAQLGISPTDVTNAARRLDRKKLEFAKLNAHRNPFRR